ncbi:hypothetical protein DOTSEDRAFT_70057 [Dothistroma septosporum NZE10]|uniref:Uncharacterized protein n=1 Tax=Dothistroma septosporum (strain NZE10 / CBS 128990) TaxID=675120 RepID=N1PR34_DOTSN|nr:hypothetical protein DOTSEDRAFT_70057 [Dothistroma septosporum NZE10]
MKSFIAASALAALAAASPVPQTGITTTCRFTGMSLRSASPIHFGQINANSNAFYIGKNTTTSCPTDNAAIAPTCATVNTNETIFDFTDGQGTLSLSTLVPGGQQVYVTEGDDATGQLAGQLKFTTAHSAATSGAALYDGFSIISDQDLQFEGKDWFACPIDDFNSGYGIWAVSRVAGSNAGDDCLEFSWRTVQVADGTESAYQYE